MKKIFTFILLIILTFSLAGCGKTGSKNVGNGNGGSLEFRRPDFGQPESRPDITGMVKTIIGNEVSVIKFEMPNMDNGQGGEEGGKEEDNGVRINPGATFGGGGGHGVGFGGMGGGRGGSQNSGDRGAFLEMMKEMSTGEEKITIQVGIRMLKFSESEGADREAIEATLSDIKVDKMISVWLDDSVTDRNLASFVLITR